MHIQLLALSEVPGSDPVSLYGYQSFKESLIRAGFTAEIVSHWPKEAPTDYWLFYHVHPTMAEAADRVRETYTGDALARTATLNLTYHHGVAAVKAGISISVGREAYADWRFGEVRPPEDRGYVVTNRWRAEACGIELAKLQDRITDGSKKPAPSDAVTLAGGMPLPELLWKCLSV